MLASIVRGFVVGVALLCFAISATSLAMLSAIHSGNYEPVADDRMALENAASLPFRLKLICTTSLGIGGVCIVWLWWSRKTTT